MLIDWFTVGAQLLNFLILVWLMKRFLYQPVLDAIAAREQKIATELADAATTRAEAKTQRDEFRRKIQDLDEQRAELLRQAKDAAKIERERLQLEAREAADAARAQRAMALLTETRNLHVEITRHTQRQVFDISRRVLGDLAGMGLEQRMCEVFIQRVQALEGPALATLGAALKGMSDAEPARVRSTFELPEAQRAAVQSTLDATFGHRIPLKFEVTPELVSGIELSAQGQKLAWSVEGYLSALSLGLEPLLPKAGGAGHPL
ncbi:F0F1 ATP synthase subunit delta [uncultured Piscinibacter sp.]|uniref:F0F1 ATP synthase subunit delta n=1 Tax=uncultured Piscinibacter sp. TaxID=1131835 RepID=UPI002618E174|nr:F0F1 ATP synthase subunit delta [uncultured Piscinibacter sp.]